MKIKSLRIHSLNIPFKVNFKHNTAQRAKTQSILVSTETLKGNDGRGEGCPREYVTKESIQSCLAFFRKHQEDILKNIHSLDDIEKWMLRNTKEIDGNPAAWCAIELSLLDALSKDLSQSVERTIAAPELKGSFQYTAILGDGSVEKIEAQVQQYKKYGFTDFKVKISGDVQTDNKKFQIILSAIPGAKIRLDANNIWQKTGEVLYYLESINIKSVAIEEPLQPLNFMELNKLTDQTTIPIILDESFYNANHFKELGNTEGNIMINLRISKMGGILRSRRIAKKAMENKIPLVIGAQVGETSILTRAALTIANEYRENIFAQEGAYGTLLLETDVTDNPLMFKNKGLLDAKKSLDLTKHGFQIAHNIKGWML